MANHELLELEGGCDPDGDGDTLQSSSQRVKIDLICQSSK